MAAIEGFGLKYPKSLHNFRLGEVDIAQRDSGEIMKIFNDNGYDFH